MKTFKPLVIIDLMREKFTTPDELDEILKDYPGFAFYLVSPKQKRTIVEFSGNCVRYIMADDTPAYSDKDVVVYDSIQNTYKFVTSADIERFGQTYVEREEDKNLRYMMMGVKIGLEKSSTIKE